MGEAGLVSKAQAGDREALGELLMAHREACYAFALRLTGRPEDAEDVCQEGFTRAVSSLPTYRGTGTPRSWLLGLIAYVHRDRQDSEGARHRRERSCAMGRDATAATRPSGLEREELRKCLDDSLGRLEDNYRLPIILHYERGLGHTEVAAALAMPEGTVKTNIRRGLEELRGMMARAGYGAAALGAVEGTLSQAPAVAVPASLTAFIGNLTAGGLGKVAAGAAIKVSARLGAKKAAGLALGWKLAAVAGAAALGAGTFIAVRPPPAPPARAAAPATPGAPGIIYDDEFKGGKLEPFWLTAMNVRIPVDRFPPQLLLDALDTGEHAVLSSRPISLDGTPLEIRLTPFGTEWPAGEHPSASGWIENVRVTPGINISFPSALYGHPNAEVVLGQKRHPAVWNPVELRLLLSPSGHLGCVLYSLKGTPRVLTGQAGGPISSITLALMARGVRKSYTHVKVSRLEKWPDDVPLEGAAAKEAQP